MNKPDLTAIVTFHAEGLLAHAALRSFALARANAQAQGVSVQFVLVLDRADETTTEVVSRHPDLNGSEKLLAVDHGDLAFARNAAVAQSDGEWLCTVDGDDLVSRSYFTKHVGECRRVGAGSVLHPEIVVSFGKYNAFNWQVDQAGEYYDPRTLLTANPWISAACAHRSVFEQIPYARCQPSVTGFGFEDWHWNCETIASGLIHRLAWGTIYLYRRKNAGSLNAVSHALSSVMSRTAFFEPTKYVSWTGDKSL